MTGQTPLENSIANNLLKRWVGSIALLLVAGGATLFVSLLQGQVKLAANRTDSPSQFATMHDGVLFVDGKPYIKKMAFFGYNHWMISDNAPEDLSLGNFMKLPFDEIGSGHDFYSMAGFNGGVYTPVGDFYNGKPENDYLRDCLKRARKVGQTVTLHVWQRGSKPVIQQMGGFYTVTATGERVPAKMSMYYEADKQAQAVRETLKPVVDAVRDDPTLIGYQIGGEGCAYFPDISYDDYTIDQLRLYLKARFSLDQLSLRYNLLGGDAYKTWDEVYPPVSNGKDVKGRKLNNFLLANWDWYRCRKAINVDVWLATIKAIEEVDGRGRPLHYEYNHGPFTDSRLFPMAEVCAKSKGLTMGPGYFGDGLQDMLSNFAFVKTSCNGPWVDNELNAGSGTVEASGRVDAAEMRRSIWGILSLGSAGYNIWTFFNILGAHSEFMNDSYYDPREATNLPLKFWEVRHCNAMIDSLGKLLAGSKSPSMPIGFFELDDSVFNWTYIASYMPDESPFDRTMTTQGMADQYGIYTEYHLDTCDLTKFKAIILPRTPRITDAHAQELANYVAEGGTLIMMGPTAKVDEAFKTYQEYPYGPLAQAAGVTVKDIPDSELSKAPLAADWKGQTVYINAQSEIQITPGSHAQVILQDAGRPLATVNQYKKGRCFYLAGEPMLLDNDDPTSAFVASLLKEGGAEPAAMITQSGKVDTGVFMSRRVGPHGTLMFLIENNDQAHHLDVQINPDTMNLDRVHRYNVFECFSKEQHEVSASNNWTFTTDLEPVGVRCFLITTEQSLDDAIPTGQRLNIPRQFGEVLEYSGPKPDVGGMYARRPYLVEDALNERMQMRRGLRIRAEEVHPQPPRDMGGGYWALDLSGYETSPLAYMIQDKDLAPKNFGAVTDAQANGNALPLQVGRNELGNVPDWCDGRFIRCEREMDGIQVGKKASTLSFFHGGTFSENTSSLGYYRINYSDGSSQRVPIVVGVTLSDSQRPSKFPTKTVTLFKGKSSAGHPYNLSRFDWANPFPDKPITTIDLVNTRNVEIVPFLVWGITIKE